MESIKIYDKKEVIDYLNKEFKQLQKMAMILPCGKNITNFDAEALYAKLDDPKYIDIKKRIVREIKIKPSISQ